MCVKLRRYFALLLLYASMYIYSATFILPLGITNDFFGKFHVVYMTRINVKRPFSIYMNAYFEYVNFSDAGNFLYFHFFALANGKSFFFLDRKRSIDMTINLSLGI